MSLRPPFSFPQGLVNFRHFPNAFKCDLCSCNFHSTLSYDDWLLCFITPHNLLIKNSLERTAPASFLTHKLWYYLRRKCSHDLELLACYFKLVKNWFLFKTVKNKPKKLTWNHPIECYLYTSKASLFILKPDSNCTPGFLFHVCWFNTATNVLHLTLQNLALFCFGLVTCHPDHTTRNDFLLPFPAQKY